MARETTEIGAPERYVSERALAAVKSLTNARTASVFRFEGAQLSVFASVSLDQSSIDLVKAVWSGHEASLRRGEMFYSAELHTDRRLARIVTPSQELPSALCVVPSFHGETLAALLYVDSLEPYFCTRHDQQRLADLCALVGAAIGGERLDELKGHSESWAQYLEAGDPVFNKERDELLLLLNRTDWNIARVARILGVSRRTLYVRLEKYRIPREHVEKKGTGGRRTGRGTSETRTYPRFGSTFSVKPGKDGEARARTPEADPGPEERD
jgi:hypothetical protein